MTFHDNTCTFQLKTVTIHCNIWPDLFLWVELRLYKSGREVGQDNSPVPRHWLVFLDRTAHIQL